MGHGRVRSHHFLEMTSKPVRTVSLSLAILAFVVIFRVPLLVTAQNQSLVPSPSPTPTDFNSSVATTKAVADHLENSTEAHTTEAKCHGEDGREFNSDVKVARFEFERVETIFVILVFIMVVVLAKMG